MHDSIIDETIEISNFDRACFVARRAFLWRMKFAMWQSRAGHWIVKDQDTFCTWATRRFGTEIEAVTWATRAWEFKTGQRQVF